jgi:hypothetical protein
MAICKECGHPDEYEWHHSEYGCLVVYTVAMVIGVGLEPSPYTTEARQCPCQKHTSAPEKVEGR